MTSYTEKLNLAKQDTGAENWGTVLNANFDKIDAGFSQVGVKNYSGTETYAAGEFVIAVVDDQVGIYKSLQGGNIGHSLTDETWWEAVPLGGGGGLEVCDIGIALGIDESENKRRYLNGQVISQAQFVAFTDKLKSIVALYPNVATTEVNWQAEVTNSKLGQCGKFVIDDDAGTIRLPKVVNINGLQDLTVLGGIKAESLPNIKGESALGSNAAHVGALSPAGAFVAGTSESLAFVWNGASSQTYNRLAFNASNSSSTYQDDAPVQQEAVQYPYFIQVATGVETSIDVSREIELNNPFSLLDYKYSEYELSNTSWLLSNGQWNSGAVYQSVYNLLLQIYNGTVTKAGVSVKLSTETYADTDFVVNTTDTTFKLPIKVLMAGSKRVAGNGMTLGLTNGTNNYGACSGSSPDRLGAVTGNYNKTVGQATSGSALSGALSVGITTDETKSGIETSANGLYLYFYVGEVVQDANIIAAGQALTDIANLKNLSNLSPLGQKVIDGQWVLSELQVFTNVAFTTTHQRYSLASYLPDDEYDYEVFVQTGTANASALNILSDLGFVVASRSSGSSQLYNTCPLPIGSGRYVEAYTTSGTSANSVCVIKGYRRIGTNN